MDQVPQLVHPLNSTPAYIPGDTFQYTLWHCQNSWRSILNKFQHKRAHCNAYLVSDVMAIETQIQTMCTTAGVVSGHDGHQSLNITNCLISIKCIERQSQRTCVRVGKLIESVSEWSEVPPAIHDELSVCNTELEHQVMDIALLAVATNPWHDWEPTPVADDDDDFYEYRAIMQAEKGYRHESSLHLSLCVQKRRNLVRRLEAYKKRLVMCGNIGCQTSSPSDCSSTQSSSGTMTPMEGWSDVGNDTTKTGHEIYASDTVGNLRDALEASSKGSHEDAALETILSGISPDIQENDLAGLVFHWTTMNRFGDLRKIEATQAQ